MVESSELMHSAGGVKPAYCPYPTFKNFLARLHEHNIPQRVDRTVMDNLSGAAQSHLLGALEFLVLIDDSGVPRPALSRLVNSVGTSEWPEKLSALVRHAYANILEGIDLQSATKQQLTQAFRMKGGTEGSVTDKAVRFLLKSLEDAGQIYSPHLGRRRRSSTRKKSSSTKKKAARNNRSDAEGPISDHADPTEGMIEFPIHIPGRSGGKVVVPKDLRAEELPLIEAAIAYIRIYAEQANR